ncbi:MAG TPA: bifunctional acetate--CoA ligase family protein/GNAT family N-acetyltransferase, partial [Chloroflexota bacterium]
LRALPGPVDLALIATPAATVPALIAQCADAGVAGAIVLSSGFREVGARGVSLEQQLLAQAVRGGMRIIGPNCLGVLRPPAGLNASFAAGMALPGHVAFLSQSGALCTAVLDWSLERRLGFSAFVSTGTMLDVSWGDLIDYFGDDPQTESIVIYMESIGDARSFLSAARAVALRKPIVVLKAGRSPAAAQAAASHTGALAGSDDVLDAAFRRCGVLRVETIGDLFGMAALLAQQPRPLGPRLTILTNAGGPAVLAIDALVAAGGQAATLAETTREELDRALPAAWSHGNPIDLLGDASPERYAAALAAARDDPHSDGLLVILTPQAMTDATQTAEHVAAVGRAGKPLLASWMGAAQVAAGAAVLERAGIPTFAYPDDAARAFAALWRSADSLRALYETPALPPNEGSDRVAIRRLITAAGVSGRTLLTELEAKQVLAAAGIPTVPTLLAGSEDEAVNAAQATGYPVAIKLHSLTVTHKTDVGGVQLRLADAAEVRGAYRRIAANVTAHAGDGHFQGVTVQPMVQRDGYELILGSSVDPQFGPVLLVGTGGQLVEVFQDRALGLPPLNTTLARRMLEQTRIFRALQGVRGRAGVDLDALAALLVQFSRLIIEQPRISECDINPLLVSPEGLVALDARVVLFPAATAEVALPRPAIRPYPLQYVQPWRRSDGRDVLIRPIRPEDEPLLVAFHRSLSEESVYLRYFHSVNLEQRIAHDRLIHRCAIDYDREMALVAEESAATGGPTLLGVGRWTRAHAAPEAEFALVVSDSAQHQGLGTELLRQLIHTARAEGLRRLTGDILPESWAMQRLCVELGFHLDHPAGDTVRATLDLTTASH